MTGADVQKAKYEKHSPLHKKCRASEAQLKLEVNSCEVSYKSQKQVRDLKCQAFKDM